MLFFLYCHSLTGCRAQNQFIQVGQTQQIDTCGNRCTCNTQSGQVRDAVNQSLRQLVLWRQSTHTSFVRGQTKVNSRIVKL